MVLEVREVAERCGNRCCGSDLAWDSWPLTMSRWFLCCYAQSTRTHRRTHAHTHAHACAHALRKAKRVKHTPHCRCVFIQTKLKYSVHAFITRFIILVAADLNFYQYNVNIFIIYLQKLHISCLITCFESRIL